MRSKLQRFKENSDRNNVIEPGKDIYEKIKGKWSEHFGNDHPIVVELGCGYGEYTVGLARQFQGRNFIGVDVKGARIWKGSKTAEEENMANVAFLRSNILELERFFNQNEIDEIWITFPDPRPRKRDERRRLTSPRYLNIYKGLIRPGGMVHFKTDNTALFEYTLDILSDGTLVENIISTFDLYKTDLYNEHFGIKTRYEELFYQKGETIKYMSFNFR